MKDTKDWRNGATDPAYKLEDLRLWRFQLIKKYEFLDIWFVNSRQFSQNLQWIVFGWLVARLITDTKIYMKVQRSERSQNTPEETQGEKICPSDISTYY